MSGWEQGGNYDYNLGIARVELGLNSMMKMGLDQDEDGDGIVI